MKPNQHVLPETAVDVQTDGHGSRGTALHRNGDRPDVHGLEARFRQQPVLNTTLLVLCVAAIIVAYTAIGPPSQSSGQSTRTTTVKHGVVQSTVSGSGNVQSADQLNLGFKTGGTVTHIYVKDGQQVAQGQLLATLDPESAEVTLEQSKATLQSAEANLAKLEETEGETTSSAGSSGAGATATAATTSSVSYTTFTAATSSTSTTPTSTTTTPQTTTAPTTTGPTTEPSTKTTPTTPTSSGKSGDSNGKKTTETGSSSPTSSGGNQSTGSSTSKQSAATREANLASATAAVKSNKLTVQNDEQAVQNTKLYAPESGTIVSLSGEVGETVSGTGTTRASSSASAGSGSSSSGSGASSAPSGGSTGSASSSSSSQGSSSSSSFAVLSNVESLQLVVALSESEIGNVHVGQIATVTIEALNGRKVAAHVANVSQTPTSTSGAVSYDVTFQLDQEAEGLKVGMSATAEVVVKQAEGLNVPTSAIKANSVTVVHGGKQETRQVTTGLAGDTSTIVLSGLKVGEEVVLPTASSSSSLSSGLGSKSKGGGGLGGGLSGGIGGGGFPGGGSLPAGPPGG